MFWLIIIAGFFILVRTFIGDLLLKKCGVCAKDVLINGQNRLRSQKATLLFAFLVNGKNCKGNSVEEDLTKIGDSFCIVYLESIPGINRPLKYFELGTIKCSCK